MASFTTADRRPGNAAQEQTAAKQIPDPAGLQARAAQLQQSPAVQAQKQLAEQLNLSAAVQRQPLASPAQTTTTTAPVQLKLDKEVKINEFAKDVGANTDQKEVKTALQKVLNAAERTPLEISYDSLVADITKIANSADKLNKYAKNLESNKGKELDEELSGKKGHMIDRHVLVDREFQENRLEEENLPQATRLDKDDKSNYNKYAALIKNLEASAPKLVREHVENTSYNLMSSVWDPGGDFATAANNGARKAALQTVLAELTLSDTSKGYSIAYGWTITVGGAGVVTLTCTPTLTTDDSFKKITTEKVKGKVVESQEYAPLVMHWGSNKIKLTDLTIATTAEELLEKVNAIDFKLGVTMY